jgi:DNA gyrase subunit A
VTEADQIMLITTGGTVVRTRIAELRVIGRNAQGVTLIGLDEGDSLSGVQKVVETVGGLDDEAQDIDDVEISATTDDNPPQA